MNESAYISAICKKLESNWPNSKDKKIAWHSTFIQESKFFFFLPKVVLYTAPQQILLFSKLQVYVAFQWGWSLSILYKLYIGDFQDYSGKEIGLTSINEQEKLNNCIRIELDKDK